VNDIRLQFAQQPAQLAQPPQRQQRLLTDVQRDVLAAFGLQLFDHAAARRDHHGTVTGLHQSPSYFQDRALRPTRAQRRYELHNSQYPGRCGSDGHDSLIRNFHPKKQALIVP
jgi:hypothetical protein